MGRKLLKLLREFIDEIPDDKLLGLRIYPGNIYKNQTFRFDLVNIISTVPAIYNVHIQLNSGAKIPTTMHADELEKSNPLSQLYIPGDFSFTPDMIRLMLYATKLPSPL
ncbi:hypothetical protein NA57DRAFT_58630 [Rhizodiscina lignyota]|uniref:Uncharacterized protein n=1 Tax=Rhizodiscina lignyota TaxID=1504668 RepID=A0A9P4IDV3_9PEZI|nr:hypothetical protein NA57DRAFT_58630 [Rhizodiscina lignyota]